jgi:hypothetical protein
MSDTEQVAMAAMLEEVTVAAPLTRARETLLAAQEEDTEFGREQTRLKGERERLRSQWRGAQAAEQGSMDERVASEARELRQSLEQQAEAWQARWETWQVQRKAQSLRLLQAHHAFKELAGQAEDTLARLRYAARALAALRFQPTTRPFAKMEAEAEVERYVAKLSELVGRGEAETLSLDLQRVPSWRL